MFPILINSPVNPWSLVYNAKVGDPVTISGTAKPKEQRHPRQGQGNSAHSESFPRYAGKDQFVKLKEMGKGKTQTDNRLGLGSTLGALQEKCHEVVNKVKEGREIHLIMFPNILKKRSVKSELRNAQPPVWFFTGPQLVLLISRLPHYVTTVPYLKKW